MRTNRTLTHTRYGQERQLLPYPARGNPVRKFRWRAREIGLLYPRYLYEGPAQLAEELGRTEDAVNSQARKLGLRSLTRRQRQAQTLRQRFALARATA
jgi:hypothetical protein